jgi:hypothetical protein
MTIAWLSWSNPVALWWGLLVGASGANVALWLMLWRHWRKRSLARLKSALATEPMLALCAAYVFGCAFRSLLPRADVQRMCLFDTWLSSVLVGRSVATIAEICFALQWAIVLHQLCGFADAGRMRRAPHAVVALILLAECCSWYAVLTTNYLGNAVEEATWAAAFALIGVALWRHAFAFRGPLRTAIAMALIGVAGYLAFLVFIDVPLYVQRWQADLASGREFLGVVDGLRDASTRRIVTGEFVDWREEIPWMSLYFSLAVWSSIALCGMQLLKEHLPRYRVVPAMVG